MNGRTAFIYEDDNRNVALPNTSGSGRAFSYVNLVNLLQGMIEVTLLSRQCLSHMYSVMDNSYLEMFYSAMAWWKRQEKLDISMPGSESTMVNWRLTCLLWSPAPWDGNQLTMCTGEILLIYLILYCEAQARVRQGLARDGSQGERPQSLNPCLELTLKFVVTFHHHPPNV